MKWGCSKIKAAGSSGRPWDIFSWRLERNGLQFCLFFTLIFLGNCGMIKKKTEYVHTKCRLCCKGRCWPRHNRWKGNGVRIPCEDCRCVRRRFLCSSVKAGHWETEKAEYRNVRWSDHLIWRKSQDLLWCYPVGACIGVMFLSALRPVSFCRSAKGLCFGAAKLWLITGTLSCGNF